MTHLCRKATTMTQAETSIAPTEVRPFRVDVPEEDLVELLAAPAPVATVVGTLVGLELATVCLAYQVRSFGRAAAVGGGHTGRGRRAHRRGGRALRLNPI